MRIAFFGDSLTEGRPGISFLDKLRDMLPGHEMLNHGRRGDTVISLYRRIENSQVRSLLDLAVLWIGVNDALARTVAGHAILKWLMRQPATGNQREFEGHYRRTVELLQARARYVITASPFLIGEDLSSPWNRELGDVAASIASVVEPFCAVRFLDLRTLAADRLGARQASDYVPKSITSIACDTLFLRTPQAVDAASSRRGLQLTLDGLHLNSAGAEMVAEALRQAIEGVSASQAQQAGAGAP